QQWLQVLVDAKLPAHFLANLDLQSRRGDAPLLHDQLPDGSFVDRPSPNATVLIRPSVGYAITPWLSGWVGYLWQPAFFDDPSVRERRDVNEHRIFEQLSTSFSLGPLTLGTRTRLEQRYRAHGPGSDLADGGLPHWAHRVRQQIRGQVRLGEDSPWLAIVWDEIFFHLNQTAYPSEPGLDQNRVFLGAGYQASPELRVELGYLNQYVKRFTDADQLNHVLSASLVFRVDGSGDPPRPRR
ncbi:MAG: DUF2490 domain-containing protein, partial [Deltaproteobacteria bacterium]|nr:DUF2490 domain-containing protein [Deltaproteobacteria bacterium]